MRSLLGSAQSNKQSVCCTLKSLKQIIWCALNSFMRGYRQRSDNSLCSALCTAPSEGAAGVEGWLLHVIAGNHQHTLFERAIARSMVSAIDKSTPYSGRQLYSEKKPRISRCWQVTCCVKLTLWRHVLLFCDSAWVLFAFDSASMLSERLLSQLFNVLEADSNKIKNKSHTHTGFWYEQRKENF